jgi:hypothetical protein
LGTAGQVARGFSNTVISNEEVDQRLDIFVWAISGRNGSLEGGRSALARGASLVVFF